MRSATPWGVIEVSGPDAAALLQGQLTQDIGRVDAQHWPLAAWCSPRGRVLTVCRVIGAGGQRYLLPVPADTVAPLARRLAMFVLRADATVQARDESWLCGALDADGAARAAAALGLDAPDGPDRGRGNGRAWLTELPGGAGWELAGESGALSALALPADFERRRLEAGIPAIGAAVQDEFVPQMLNLDLIGAVRFDKGCYVGQEVVARTHNLGRIKRRMLCLGMPDGAAAAAGDSVCADGAPAGRVVAVAGTSLLAVLPLEHFGATLSLDTDRRVGLTRRPLPYPLPEESAHGAADG